MVGFRYSLFITLLPLGTVFFFIVSLVRFILGKKAATPSSPGFTQSTGQIMKIRIFKS